MTWQALIIGAGIIALPVKTVAAGPYTHPLSG